MRKIFNVTIDNNPGAWKSGGEDKSILVIAGTKNEAIEIVKSGDWGERLEVDENHNYSYVHGYNDVHKPYISSDAQISAAEIKFANYIIDITTDRERKIKRIIKNKN